MHKFCSILFKSTMDVTRAISEMSRQHYMARWGGSCWKTIALLESESVKWIDFRKYSPTFPRPKTWRYFRAKLWRSPKQESVTNPTILTFSCNLSMFALPWETGRSLPISERRNMMISTGIGCTSTGRKTRSCSLGKIPAIRNMSSCILAVRWFLSSLSRRRLTLWHVFTTCRIIVNCTKTRLNRISQVLLNRRIFLLN